MRKFSYIWEKSSVINLIMVDKTVHLNALDLDVSISEDLNFSDDGFVKSIEEHLGFLDWKYGQKMNLTRKEVRGRVGTCHRRVYGGKDFFHLFYLDSGRPIQNLEVRAHEETHFLHLVERLDFLSEQMKKRQNVEIDFEEIASAIPIIDSRLEIIADLGGIYAMHCSFGFEKMRDYCISLSSDKDLISAFDIYYLAIENSLRRSKNLRELFESFVGYWKRN